jgi:transcriptional regulator with XRE-family HTH domain
MSIEKHMLPKNIRILVSLGENIRLARLRRKLSSEQVAERAGIGRMTVYRIERGSPMVSMGNYLQVLFVLGMEKELAQVAANDPLGRKLQDAGLITKKRAPKRNLKNDRK